MIVKARAPVRIDFAGAWTDVDYFYKAFGGATLNATIDQYVKGKLVADEGNFGEKVPRHAPGYGTTFVDGPDGLLVEYNTKMPDDSGLGTSAAREVTRLALFSQDPLATREQKENIAESAYRIEQVLGIIGGKQDQFASAVGGINLFEFRENGTTTHPVTMPESQIAELESLLVLCYTGECRLSSNIHKSVWGNFHQGRRETVDALFTLRDSAYAGKEILKDSRWDEFGPLLTRQFECMKALDSSTTNTTVDGLFDLVKGDISGGKPCGAGGGGYLLFGCNDLAGKARVQSKIRDAGFRVVDFSFEFEGVATLIE